jgi:hypothetical protein
VRILIIGNGVGHDVQEVHAADDDIVRRASKTEFEGLVRRRITERGVQFIGEEARFGVRTIAQSLGPRWANIDMPLAEREARSVAEEQRKRTPIPMYLGENAATGLTDEGYQRDLGDGWVQIDHRVPSDEVREQYMFDKVMQGVRGTESVIVICGSLHSKQLGDRFQSDPGNAVEVELWESARHR